MILLAVAAGGFLGTVARYGLSTWVQRRTGITFPWGTLSVNLLGSLLLGACLPVLAAGNAQPRVSALVTVGAIGAFTTFSTFAYEAFMLAREDGAARAALYAATSVTLGLLSLIAGFGLATLIT
ncbi:MAG TPA: CrcB family protein [Longimicrobiales bacterium]|nr:CrcB family protein [Longimicrobiales bacterium]